MVEIINSTQFDYIYDKKRMPAGYNQYVSAEANLNRAQAPCMVQMSSEPVRA